MHYLVVSSVNTWSPHNLERRQERVRIPLRIAPNLRRLRRAWFPWAANLCTLAMMKKKLNNVIARALCCTCLFSVASISHAATADWKPELVDATGSVRGPSEPIRFKLPRLPLEVLQRLALEFDDMDVTGFVTTEGDFAIFTSPQPFPYGAHRLRMVEYATDGNIIERGLWTVEIRKTAVFRDAQLLGATTLYGSYRIADDLPEPAPEKGSANASARMQGLLADDGWKVNGWMDFLYTSQPAPAASGTQNSLNNVSRYLVTAEAGPVVAQVGHHSIASDGLVMQGFNRRGVSIGAQSQELGTSLTAFSIRSQDIGGLQSGLGIGESDNRTNGMVLTSRPVSSQRDALALSATVVNGEGPSQTGAIGTGIAGDKTSGSGRAAGIVADSNLFDRRLRLRGEYASSEFDLDGRGRDTDLNGTLDSNLPAERDRAYAGLLTYTPWHDMVVGDQPLVWNMGMENRRLGTYFKSPANPSGAADRDATRVFTGVHWAGLGVQLSAGRETDNVNDIALLPRTESVQKVASLTYSPLFRAPPGAITNIPEQPWYGRPVFSATVFDLEQNVDRAATGLPAGALNSITNVVLVASFAYTAWNWSIVHSRGNFTNHINVVPDTYTQVSQLNANFRVGQRLDVRPALQYSAIEESDPPAGVVVKDSTTATAILGLGYLFTENVSGNLGLNYGSQEVTNGSLDNKVKSVTANLQWNAIRAQGMQPGVSFALDGLYYDVEDSVYVGNTRNNYQIFLRIGVSWLPNF